MLKWKFSSKFRNLVKISLVGQAPGARPTNDISIEFEIQPKFAVL